MIVNSSEEDSSEDSSYEEEKDYINQILDESELGPDNSDKDCLGSGLCTCDNCINSINFITLDQANTLISIL